MKYRLLPFAAVLAAFVFILAAGLMTVAAQDEPSEADLIERGQYLVEIAGCVSCHTPHQAEYSDPASMTPEQLTTLVVYPFSTLDKEERLLAGGRPFDLGPGGVVITRNLTPDEETGLGAWTDAEIEAAIRIGVSRDGTRLHPVMPYRNFYTLARQDLAAIIAYLRSIPAVENEVQRGVSGEGIAPELIPPGELPETGPDNSDPVARGAYLVNTVMSCGDCHIPLDPETGAPIMERFLAGGQPFEGPWGIVYGANLTPHETGLGEWTDEQILAAMYQGVNREGRQLILMPWEDYAPLTREDANAIIAYLREGVQPVDNPVPQPQVNEPFVQITEVTTPAAESASAQGINTPLILAVAVGVILVIVVLGLIVMRRRS